MIQAALDESGIILKQLVDWHFKFYFPSHEVAFLTIGMVFVLFRILVTVEKRPARSFVPQGGSDPTKRLGGFAAPKWGRSRLFLPFFHGDFLLFAFRISPVCKDFGASYGEDVVNFEGAECNSYLLHLVIAAFASLTVMRLNKSVSNSTLH